MLQEPCRTPLIKPRERIGHCSIARAAPAGHSAPMPMPKRVRNTSRNSKVGENPAMKLQIEYQKIEIISGVLRPTRSASQPDATAPSSRIHNVSARIQATSLTGTPNSSAIGFMIKRKTVKSKASSVQPSQAAHHAYHWSLSGSFHQATRAVSAPIVIAYLSHPTGSFAEPCRQDRGAVFECHSNLSRGRGVAALHATPLTSAPGGLPLSARQ